MLYSMTGHGDARREVEGLAVAAEIRSVNNRYLKVSVRGNQPLSSLESRIESLVRKHIRRGTLNLTVNVHRDSSAAEYSINQAVIENYRQQLRDLGKANLIDEGDSPSIDALLLLPGVIQEPSAQNNSLELEWPVIEDTVQSALTALQEMRAAEGEAMTADLQKNCDDIETELAQVRELAPNVASNYQARLTERINKLLAAHDVAVKPQDVVREVGIFADRCDISEEVVRLASHIEQFRNIMSQAESVGRKLDFLVQEMFRETNTIGSKANDAGIAQHVVEMKTRIERMREMIQNIE